MALARRRPALAPVASAAALCAGWAADLAFDPAHRHVPLCPFHAATGWWCPLCGGLRAAQALAHGQVGLALRDNVLLIAALPVLGYGWWMWLSAVRAGRSAPTPTGRLLWLAVAVAVVFTVVRNLPPLTMLRPS